MEPFEAELKKQTDPITGDLLGAVAMVIDNQGHFLYRHAAGRQRLDAESPPLDNDCTIALASAGHFLTNIAALQLVERNLVTLDEPISKYVPEIDNCLVIEKLNDEIKQRRPRRCVTLRDLLISTSGMGTVDTYDKLFNGKDSVPPLEYPEEAHPVAKDQFTHLFFEPGEGFEYGWGFYAVQLLVQRVGDRDRLPQYVDDHIFGVLGMTSSTYLPLQTPHVWRRRLQMVRRQGDTNGKPRLAACDKETYGLTCSISDLARLFGDLMSPECKLLKLQEHRDMLFTPQLTPGSQAHQALLAETTNYGFLLPLEHGVSHEVSWALKPPPAVNWTVAGSLIEEDNALPGTGIPKGTVMFEGQPNVIWTMNREKGRMMLFGHQLLPGYDVKAHNLAVRFLYHAWKMFG